MTTLTELIQKKARDRDAADRRKLGHVVLGVDLDSAFAAYRKYPPFAGNLGHVKIKISHRSRFGTGGRADQHGRRLSVTVGRDASIGQVLETLVHEMCHLVIPSKVAAHGERFRLTLKRALKEIWGLDIPTDLKPTQGCIAYSMDALAVIALDEKHARGELQLFPPPATSKPSRAELTQKTVERRAQHAVRMLAKAEKKAKAAQRSMKKWRAKVRYYEKKAASKGSMKETANAKTDQS